jgi:two-component system, sensor histidine kinase and response regulator
MCTSQLAFIRESIGVVQMNSQQLSTDIPPSLLESLGSDRALLRELVGMFLEDCPKQLESIRDAVQRRDAVALRSAAHLLRGCVGNFGVSAAYEAARRLENMGREGNWTDVEARYACLESELRRLELALAQLIRAGIPLCASEVSR